MFKLLYNRFYFLGSKITEDGDYSHETNLDSILKSRDIILLTKIYLVKAMVFPNNHVRMWESDHKEAWMPKSWYFWIVVLEKTIESPMDSKEIKLVNPKGNQPWIFIGRSNAKAETPVLLQPDLKGQHTGKDPDAGKDLRQKEKEVAEDERLDFITRSMDMNLSKLVDSEGQRRLSYRFAELDTTLWLNNNINLLSVFFLWVWSSCCHIFQKSRFSALMHL